MPLSRRNSYQHNNYTIGEIHGPRDYDTKEKIEHWKTCITNIKLSIVDGSVGHSRLHNALDLPDGTARSREPRAVSKWVHFSLDSMASISDKRNISYFTTDLDDGDIGPEADRIAYYCANRRCGCNVDQFFRTDDEHDEHDEHVRETARRRTAVASPQEGSQRVVLVVGYVSSTIKQCAYQGLILIELRTANLRVTGAFAVWRPAN